MNNNLEELSKPVAWFTDDYLTDKSATTYNPEMAQRWREKPWFVGNLYSQEYVSVLVQRAERLDSMLTESVQALKAAEQRIAELEEQLKSSIRRESSARKGFDEQYERAASSRGQAGYAGAVD